LPGGHSLYPRADPCADGDHVHSGPVALACSALWPVRADAMKRDLPVRKTRIAILGLGMAVTPHAKGLLDLQDEVEVVYAFAPSPERRAAFAARFPFPTAESLDQILADPT